ncbi:MAG: hypothetical protein ABSC22_10445 [Roseiarcus sp.]
MKLGLRSKTLLTDPTLGSNPKGDGKTVSTARRRSPVDDATREVFGAGSNAPRTDAIDMEKMK